MTNSNRGVDLFALIEDDRHRVSYRPSWNQFTGGVNGTLLLQQVIYWWSKNKRRPFYKFNSACDHPNYRDGDSWQEELGMTRSEFETARRKIAAKTKGNVSQKALVSYWVDPDRRTWYALNEEAVIAELQAIYPEKHEEPAVGVQADLMQESSIRSGISPDLAEANAGILHYVMQESSITKCRNPAIELMQESCNRNNTETTRDQHREDGREAHPQPPPTGPVHVLDKLDPQRPFDDRLLAIAEVCGLRENIPKHREWCEQAASQVHTFSGDYIRARYGPEPPPGGGWHWYSDDWRGQRGDMPSPPQVVETIAKRKTAVRRKEANGRSGSRAADVAADYAAMKQEYFSHEHE